MTKKELLDQAAKLNIKGRWEMTKEELEKAIDMAKNGTAVKGWDSVETSTEDDETEVSGDDEKFVEEINDEDLPEEDDASDLGEEPTVTFDPKSVKEAKSRYMSLAKRGPDNKVIRKGVKFNQNVPFHRKPYYLSPLAKGPEFEAALTAAPPQVRKIVAWMSERGMTSPDKAMLGREIVTSAKEAGVIQTRIDSALLFAYHRRTLERVGVIHFSGTVDDEG